MHDIAPTSVQRRPFSGEGDIEGSKILVVDDSTLMRELIAAQLRKHGYYNFLFASNGREALDVIKNDLPDLVVLDLIMPEMDGFEVCRHLRLEPRTADLPVLVQTAMEETDKRLHVFEAGATDMVLKPINPLELSARVRIHLENRLLLSRLSAFRSKMKSELNLAHEMQRSLLPTPEQVGEIGAQYGTSMATHYEGSMELGGDIWGVKAIDERRFAVYVTDFSGHGVGAALNTFRFHTFMLRPELVLADPLASMEAFNTFLSGVLQVGQYATMFYGVIDIEASCLRYVSAAAPVPIVRIGNDEECICLDSAGLPLGIEAESEYELREIEFPPGSFLFLYSDALIETPTMSDPVFQPETLRSYLTETRQYDDPSMVVRTTVDRLNAEAPEAIADDLTILSLYRRNKQERRNGG